MEMAISIPSSAATLSLSPSIPGRRRRTTPSRCLSFTSSNSSFFGNNLTHQIRASTRVPIRTRARLSCNCLFGLGVPELVVIAGVAALVFGPKKLPEVGRSIGKTVKSFQQAAKEFESELKKEPGTAIEPPVEKPTAATSEEEEKEVKVSSTNES